MVRMFGVVVASRIPVAVFFFWSSLKEIISEAVTESMGVIVIFLIEWPGRLKWFAMGVFL